MLANDYFDRCDDESKQIIHTFLSFVYYSAYTTGVLKKVIYPENLNNDVDVIIFYFLYINYLFNKSFRDICDNHNVNIKNYFNVPDIASKLMNDMFNINYNRRFRMAIEVFYNYHIDVSSMFNAYTDFDKIICTERIILNMIKDTRINHKDIFTAFKINEIVDDLGKLAIQKESSKKITNNIKALNNIPYGEDLTTKKYNYNPLVGRDKEFRNMCALLMDDEKSLLIHGNPGVGKTALVNGLAYKIQDGNISPILANKHILQISGSELVSGCKYVGMLEERVLEIINYVINNKDIILFIDEIHTIIGLGQSSKSNNDVSNILKPYLGDGKLKIIGATTTEEYNNIITNGAFARRFNSLEVKPLSNEDILTILDEVIKRFKTQSIDFKYNDQDKYNLLNLIIELSNRKNPNALLQKKLYNPDLAITILRNGYNFAMLDNKDALDIDSIVEGLNAIDYFRENAIKEFQDKALILTRAKPNLTIIK